MAVLEMGGGRGLLVRKFLRYKVDGSYDYTCSEYDVVYELKAG